MAKFSGSSKTGSATRKSSNESAQSETHEQPSFADGDLGKIQALLFGEQTARYNTELAALESSMSDMSSRVANELGNRIASLEKDYNHRLEVLTKRVDEALASLESDKVDKKVLADILTKSATEIRKG